MGNNVPIIAGLPDTITGQPGIPVIVGGQDVTSLSQVPWQASIRIRFPGSTFSSPHCGGTILSSYWILTAAHCFSQSTSVDDYVVRMGDLDNTQPEATEQEFRVWVIRIHPSFVASTYDYDIALVAVRPINGRPIQFSSSVQPARIPSASTTIIPRYNCFISGWGRTTTDIGGPVSDILQIAPAPVLDHAGQALCNQRYQNRITDRMLCAGYIDGTPIDSCGGDSGGPLVCRINDQNVVVGITSWGTTACAQNGYPGVYSNVQYLRNWIFSQ